ncbi:unnamed protein product [Rotaria socialis]|uniref:DNA polymerase n=1 Tax=Rotaria socialis TaxID=392032 RepID=A0A817T2Z7_9BILA|nr:unnamed protein product [Rotaria socialis]CAF3411472.1 unnamed protein product [Rotaria socialis]CAF3713791.1 unnamed protein product [Rotaria socialis]CAF3770752.1 unnamed protein product [Rotaria socialis]CAF4133251.1 unnamed protein product [Rotaria socialis]
MINAACRVHLLPNSVGKGRLSIFREACTKFSLECVTPFNIDNVECIIVEDSLETNVIIEKILHLDPSNAYIPQLVSTRWLSDSLRAQQLLPREPFIRSLVFEVTKTLDDNSNTAVNQKLSRPQLNSEQSFLPRKRSNSDSDYDEDVDMNKTDEELVTLAGKEITFAKGNWMCCESSALPVDPVNNPNQAVIDKLQEMANLYRNSNDKWRAYGYQKAISTLKKCHKPATTYEEIRMLPGIGSRLAEKIVEIMETGSMIKLEEYQTDADIAVMDLFGQIWGIGPAQAKRWVDLGYRTLDDLRTKARLTHNQMIGLKYYSEFLERIPREEVSQIESVVREAAASLRTGLLIQTCGSYRRGKATCGDCDILITHRDGVSHEHLLFPLVDKLKATNFLVDDLVYTDKHDEEPGAHMRYFGVCKLPGENTLSRRIDIIIVPYSEHACALLYFTGSMLFNRSMRQLADENNMYLSQHRLHVGVIRMGKNKVNEGRLVPTPTEESIFQYLKLPYRPPAERDY